jgi:hypothetical protein
MPANPVLQHSILNEPAQPHQQQSIIQGEWQNNEFQSAVPNQLTQVNNHV